MIENKLKVILEILKKRKWTIGVMESCTGGAVANWITNIPGVSDVFKEGKVTYSNEAKIRAGVSENIIKKFGVYSIETAEEMAKKIEGEVGVGVTGNLNFPGEVFVAVRIENDITSEKLNIEKTMKRSPSLWLRPTEARKEMKRRVVERVVEMIASELD